jgi:hypothetical protein
MDDSWIIAQQKSRCPIASSKSITPNGYMDGAAIIVTKLRRNGKRFSVWVVCVPCGLDPPCAVHICVAM